MRVLVANRGEIALRLIQALDELRIESVAIHTPTDKLHIATATHAVEIPTAAIFMQTAEIIRVAKESQCHAVLPGYGFLSESAEFARACQDAGLTFCGPSAEVLSNLGDKSSAKQIAKELGIPILPSQQVSTVDDVEKFAHQVHYPIMLKAQDGGGGKGIRIVTSKDQVPTLMEEAMNESPSRLLFAEKAALEGFKHIEIQVVADRHGNVRTVFERECSLQRKFQKVIEIAPSSLPRARISALEQASIKIAKHVGYIGLGTFEFLVNARGRDYYFMECNPRIQVEHTITEEISGLDLAHLLIRVTLQGLNLDQITFPQKPQRCSIQCRVNAEDPKTFLPSQGTITDAVLPCGPGIRVDTLLARVNTSSTYVATDEYDSLVAKIITTSADHDGALRKAVVAFKALSISGIVTNQSLLIGLLHSNLMIKPQETDIRSLSQAGVIQSLNDAGTKILSRQSDLEGKRLDNADGSPAKGIALTASTASGTLKKGDSFTLRVSDDKSMSTQKQLKIEKILKNNFPEQLSAVISVDGQESTMHFEKSVGSSNHRKADPLNASHISSPFAGVLIEMLVEAGDQIEEAETIAIFRQGKMELDVRAPYQGTISEVAQIKEGETVGTGALIAVISPAGAVAKL